MNYKLSHSPHKLKVGQVIQPVDSFDGKPCGVKYTLLKFHRGSKKGKSNAVKPSWECSYTTKEGQDKVINLPVSYFDNQAIMAVCDEE